MRFKLFVVLVTLVRGDKVSGQNCLRANPGILDAEFYVFNRYEDRSSVTSKDVASLAAIFSTRFKRAHTYSKLPPAWMEIILRGLSQNSKSKKSFEIILDVDPNFKKGVLNRAYVVYKEYYDAILRINSDNEGPLVGINLSILADTFKEQLEAVESVFGPIGNSTFPVGAGYKDCFKEFKKKSGLRYFQRMQFLSCGLEPANEPSPEKSANDVLTRCGELRNIAASINITAEIMCLVSYPSFGTSAEGIVGSVSKFQRFWCRIIDQVLRDKSLPRIVFRSAFDLTTTYYNESTLTNGFYNGGWWRRRQATSYDASAFVEKVDVLEVGSGSENCSAECSFCGSSAECCGNRYCHPDTSFQPLEKLGRRKVCQSTNTKCAPRTPQTSATRPTETPRNASWPAAPAASSFAIFYIALSIISAILIVLAFVVIFVWRSAKQKGVLTEHEIARFFEGTVGPIKPIISGTLESHLNVGDFPYDKRLELAQDIFEIYENLILGSGTFGVVVKGRVHGKDVAVKTTLPGLDKVYISALLMELKVLMYLGKHQNIVNLLGAHTQHLTSGKIHMFLELCPLGDLFEFLRSRRDNFGVENDTKGNFEDGVESNLTCKHLILWSIQIANAIGHLETKKVIHADIAARNILVVSTEQVKLTDFGLSRRLYEYSNYVKSKQEPLPWRHMSVEALQDLNFSAQSDVWAFGVTLWKIFSLGMVPYSGYSWSLDFVGLLLSGIRLQSPQYAHPLVYEVMTSCWTDDTKSRPPIVNLERKLTSALNELSLKGTI